MTGITELSKAPSKPMHIFDTLLPGIYTITNLEDLNYALDLSGYDNSSVLAYYAHGGDNQKWRLDRLGGGYSIRSVVNGGYMTLSLGTSDQLTLVANEYPVSWEMEGVNDADRDAFRVRWPHSSMILGISEDGSHTARLENAMAGKRTQEWRLTLVSPTMPVPQCYNESTAVSIDTETLSPEDVSATKTTSSTEINLADLKAGAKGKIYVTTTTTVQTIVTAL